MIMLFLFLLFFFSTTAEDSYNFLKNPSERVTSFILSEDNLIFTYLDMNKEEGAPGIVKKYKIGTKKEPEKWELLFLTPLLISPIALERDSCNRIWILDSSVQNISGSQVKTLPPVLHAFELGTNDLAASFVFDENFRDVDSSFFGAIAVETDDDCRDTWTYIADFNRANLLVYSLSEKSSKIRSHSFFGPDPSIHVPSNSILNGPTIPQNGIYGLAVSGSDLVFHAFGSKHDYSIRTELLKSDEPLSNLDFVSLGLRDIETGIIRYDPIRRIYFYADLREMGCWTDNVKYTKINAGIRDGFITDVKINNTEIWVLVNRDNEYYFKVWKVSDFVRDTPCLKSAASPLTFLTGFVIFQNVIFL